MKRYFLSADYICDNEIGAAGIVIMDGSNTREFVVYYSELRISDDNVPEHFHKYEVRGSDKDGRWSSVENHVVFNHVATILSEEEIPMTETNCYGTQFAKIDDYNVICPPPSETDDDDDIDVWQ